MGPESRGDHERAISTPTAGRSPSRRSRSSSGKLFVDGLDPRQVDEILAGNGIRDRIRRWSMRVYGRYRKGSNFWEDVNNTARKLPRRAGGGRRPGLYIADLAADGGPRSEADRAT